MKIDRKEWLTALESVTGGLATKEVIEQSSCFVFRGTTVSTFNDLVAATADQPVRGIDGAVAAEPLLALLRKLNEPEIDVSIDDSSLIIKGKRRRAGVLREAEIVLPLDTVEAPTKYRKLHPNFADAVAVVRPCAGKDASRWQLTCLHLCPTHIEATDNWHMIRWNMEEGTGLRQPCLVLADAMKHVAGLGVTHVAEGEAWLHFRNANGLRLAVRREADEYVDLDQYFENKKNGYAVRLPTGLKEALEKVEIFSSKNIEDNLVTVTLKDNTLSLKGESATGWYEERKKVAWPHPPLRFRIEPKLLGEIVQKETECKVGEAALRVDSAAYSYITALTSA